MKPNILKLVSRYQTVNLAKAQAQSIVTCQQFEPISICKRFSYQPDYVWLQATNYCTNPKLKDDKTSSPSSSNTNQQAVSGNALSHVLRAGQQRINNKINNIYQSYEELSHTNEVRAAHQHVENLQEELKAAQERRRDIAKQLSDIRYELQLCYADLANCKKGEPRYLELIRKEYDIHHREKTKMEEFELLDKEERDLFMHLQAAVKTSHEKEKIHTNSAKYWSIVGSLLGALLGICGTAFSFYNRNNMITTMLGEVKTEFVQLREETKIIGAEVQRLSFEQRRQFNELKRINKKELNNSNKSNESWMHWIGRYTGAIPIYRYFYPKEKT